MAKAASFEENGRKRLGGKGLSRLGSKFLVIRATGRLK
jgi:hypothetical protein